MKGKIETIKKWVIGKNVNHPYYCVWLQEMAEQGWVLKKHGILRDEFERVEPHKRRYRLVEKSYYGMTGEELLIYEETGWEKVWAGGELTLMANSDENASEIYSDSDSYFKSIRGKWISYLILILFWSFYMARVVYALVNFFGGGEYTETYGRLHNLEEPIEFYLELMAMGILLIIWMLVDIVFYIKDFGRYLRREMPNYDIPYDAPDYIRTKRVDRTKGVMGLATIVCMAFLLTAIIIDNNKIPLEGTEALGYNGAYPVMFKEVDPETWEKMVPLIEAYYNGEDSDGVYDITYMADKENGTIFRKTYSERLIYSKYSESDYSEYREEYIYYLSEYKKARSVDIAEEYLGEEIAFELYEKVDKGAWKKALNAAEIECEGVDYAGYYAYHSDSDEEGEIQQNLYLRKGDIIEIVNYTGSVDIREKIDLFVKEIN